MKHKICYGLVILGAICFILCGVNFLFEFMPKETVPAAGVLALVFVGSGAHFGRSATK